MDVPDTVRRMDLNLIVPLNALLEQRHVTRAAESVGIGQSAMSAALGLLRRLFDDPLLVRSGRVHELTPMGQSLIEPVHAVLTSRTSRWPPPALRSGHRQPARPPWWPVIT